MSTEPENNPLRDLNNARNLSRLAGPIEVSALQGRIAEFERENARLQSVIAELRAALKWAQEIIEEHRAALAQRNSPNVASEPRR